MPKRASSSTTSTSNKKAKPNPTTPSSRNPYDIDYKAEPHLYRILRGEMNVFKTNPYSETLKPLWRFKDEAAARKSAESLWQRFEQYREEDDFVGMDVTRKFIQMGYTRSTRYALRPGGRKYDADGKEMARTGEIADMEKYKGSQIFKEYWTMCEEDEQYVDEKERWRLEVEDEDAPKQKSRGAEGEVDPVGVGSKKNKQGAKMKRESGCDDASSSENDTKPEIKKPSSSSSKDTQDKKRMATRSQDTPSKA